MESVTIFKSKTYGAEIKTVYGDDSADDTDACTNAVVATVTTPATDSNEVERQGRGCPICRTDIQMILRLFDFYVTLCTVISEISALNNLVIFGYALSYVLLLILCTSVIT